MNSLKKIGSKIYAVNKRTVDEKLKNGKVLVGRIKSYQNINDEIEPIVQEVGSKKEIYFNANYFFSDLENAVDAIRTKKNKS